MHIVQFIHIGFGLLYHAMYCPNSGDIQNFKVFTLDDHDKFEEVKIGESPSTISKIIYEESHFYLQEIIKNKLMKGKSL